MKVPCPNPSRWATAGLCESKERSGPLITLPGAERPATGVTPESRTATSTPAPVMPWLQAAAAPRPAEVLSIE